MVAADVGPDIQQKTARHPLEQEVSRSAETTVGPQTLGQTSVPAGAVHLCSSDPEKPCSPPGYGKSWVRFSPLHETLLQPRVLIFAAPAASTELAISS